MTSRCQDPNQGKGPGNEVDCKNDRKMGNDVGKSRVTVQLLRLQQLRKGIYSSFKMNWSYSGRQFILSEKLKPVWNSTAYQYKTKLKIFRSNVLAVLLYGAETWKMTEHDACRLDRFQRGCLRRIFRIFWPEKITNKDLYKKAEMIPVSDMIADRRWRWLGHVLRLESINHAKVSLTWSPEGRRRRGRPKTTWRRTVESE